MGRVKLVPMTANGSIREFGVAHAKNILMRQQLSGRQIWKIVPDSGFTFEDNELIYKRNTRKSEEGDQG